MPLWARGCEATVDPGHSEEFRGMLEQLAVNWLPTFGSAHFQFTSGAMGYEQLLD
jgi:hypothetical protein